MPPDTLCWKEHSMVSVTFLLRKGWSAGDLGPSAEATQSPGSCSSDECHLSGTGGCACRGRPSRRETFQEPRCRGYRPGGEEGKGTPRQRACPGGTAQQWAGTLGPESSRRQWRPGPMTALGFTLSRAHAWCSFSRYTKQAGCKWLKVLIWLYFKQLDV